MRIDWALTCRYAESDGALGNIIGAGVDVLFVPELPARAGLMVAVRLALSPEEANTRTRHTVAARVLDDGGAVAAGPQGDGEASLSVTLETPGGMGMLVPGWVTTPMLAFEVAWWASDAGSFTVEITLPEAETAAEAQLLPVHVRPAP